MKLVAMASKKGKETIDRDETIMSYPVIYFTRVIHFNVFRGQVIWEHSSNFGNDNVNRSVIVALLQPTPWAGSGKKKKAVTKIEEQ